MKLPQYIKFNGPCDKCQRVTTKTAVLNKGSFKYSLVCDYCKHISSKTYHALLLLQKIVDSDIWTPYINLETRKIKYKLNKEDLIPSS